MFSNEFLIANILSPKYIGVGIPEFSEGTTLIKSPAVPASSNEAAADCCSKGATYQLDNVLWGLQPGDDERNDYYNFMLLYA